MFSRIKLSYLFTNITGFDTSFTNLEATLKQRRDKVVSTLFQLWFNVGHRRCINVVFHFQRRINAISILIYNVETMLIHRRNVGWVPFDLNTHVSVLQK